MKGADDPLTSGVYTFSWGGVTQLTVEGGADPCVQPVMLPQAFQSPATVTALSTWRSRPISAGAEEGEPP